MLFKIDRLSVEVHEKSQRRPLLEDVSLCVDEGEFVALVGESGSGKTMTALSAMHLLSDGIRQTGGAIYLGETCISSLGTKEFRSISGNEISMIFQEPMTSLNPLIRVGTQIEEAGIIHGQSKQEAQKKAESLAKLMGLSDTDRILRSFPHELSGGMKQRIMIAMALMNETKLLIADEPTTALDVLTQEEIIKILQKLRETQKIAMLLITHDLSVVKKLCSRVYIMHNGKIKESGTTEEIFKNPKDEYTKALLNALIFSSQIPQERAQHII